MALFGGGVCDRDISNLLCAEPAAAQIVVFSLSGESNSPCHRPDNPFLSKTLEPTIIYRGGGFPLKSGKDSSRQSEKQGVDEGTVRKIAIAWPVALPYNSWAYISYRHGEIIGGAIVNTARGVSGFLTLTVDAGKVMPIAPAIVGVGALDAAR